MNVEAYSEALKKALKRLQTSDRYESEVRSALSGFEADIVNRVVAELHARRYLDDARTTRHMVESNAGRRAVGDHRLRERLERRGASDSDLAAALSEAQSEADRIDEILQTKYSPEDDPAKAGRFLYGRGFSEEAIEAGLSRYFGEREA